MSSNTMHKPEWFPLTNRYSGWFSLNLGTELGEKFLMVFKWFTYDRWRKIVLSEDRNKMIVRTMTYDNSQTDLISLFFWKWIFSELQIFFTVGWWIVAHPFPIYSFSFHGLKFLSNRSDDLISGPSRGPVQLSVCLAWTQFLTQNWNLSNVFVHLVLFDFQHWNHLVY